MTGWWIVTVEGEFPNYSYGPFRSIEAAEAVADKWNSKQHKPGDDRAFVMALRAPKEIVTDLKEGQ